MLNIQSPGVPRWVEQGPAPILDENQKIVGTGAIVDVAVHPEQAGTIYVATAGGGVWRTRNATPDNLSPTWEPLSDAYPSTAMASIAFARGDPAWRTLFAGTGNFSSFGPTGPAVGLYRTLDGGETWTIVGASVLTGCLTRHILPLAPPNAQVILVSAISNQATGGVFRSEDAGDSFSILSAASGSGLPSGDGMQMIEDPLQPGRVYAGIAGPQAGIFRSDDAGKSWSPVTNGPLGTALAAVQWIRFALQPGRGGSPSTLYAGVIDSTFKLVGLYQSAAVPGQEAWTSITLPAGGAHAIYPFAQEWKFAMAAHPLQPMLIVAADEGGVWRADLTKAGQPTWLQISGTSDYAGDNVPAGAPHADCQTLVFDSNHDLLAANDGGLYRLRDPGSNPRWLQIGGQIRNDEPLSVAYDTLARVVTVGSGDNGVSYQAHTGAQTFISLGAGDGGGQVVDNGPADHSVRYSVWVETTDLTSLMRYTFNASNALQDATSVPLAGIPDADHKESGSIFINNLPEYGARLIVGATRLFESVNRGETVQPLLDLGTNRPAGGPQVAYGSRSTDGASHPEVAYVGIGNQLWLRGANAAGFQQVLAYAGGSIAHVAVDLYDWQRAYVLDNTHVYRTVEAGAKWSDCTGNLTQVATDAQGGTQLGKVLVYRTGPEGADEAVLVGGMGGIFRTLNPADGPGARWTYFAANLPRCFGQDVKYYPGRVRGQQQTGDVLVASLQGRGVWTLNNASAELLRPSVLEIEASNGSRTVQLMCSANVPGLLQVFDGSPIGTPSFSVPLKSLERIVVRCAGDDNTLIVDGSHGPIALSGGIDFTATGDRNRIVMQGGSASHCEHLQQGSSGRVLLGGGVRIDYRGVQRVDDTVRSPSLLVRAPARLDRLVVSDGPAGPRSPTIQLRSLIGAAQLELNVANQERIEVDLGVGAGEILLDNLLQVPRFTRQLVLQGSTTQRNDVRIGSTPSGLATEIRGRGGSDSVTIGSLTGVRGNLAGVKGPISVSNAGGKTLLSVLDAESAAPAVNAQLTSNALIGLAPASIQFDPSGLAGLDIGFGGGSFSVQETSVPTTIQGGRAISLLRVIGTTALLEFETGTFIDRVEIGNGRLDALKGAIHVRCSPQGNVNVTVDDSADTQPREVVVDAQSVNGLAPAEIRVAAGSNPALNGLTVRGGSARMFYSLVDTPPLFTLSLHGQGQDVVNVSRARQRLDIDGATALTLGSPALGLVNVAGDVHLGAGGPTTLTVDDTASSTTREMGLNAVQITGLTPQAISFAGASIRTLNVRCGSGGTTLDIAGTPAAATTSLELGPGTDRVNVKASESLLAIGATGGAGHTVVIGSTAPDVSKDELAPIAGQIRIGAGSQHIDLVVSDGGGHVGRTGEMIATGLVGLAPGAIAFGDLHSLAVRLSGAGNQFLVRSTPSGGTTTLYTGGRDNVEVKPTRDAACDLLVQGPTASHDSLRVLATDTPPPVVTVTQPGATSPGAIRVSYSDGTAHVISYQHIVSARTA